jgi:hypothetical protein
VEPSLQRDAQATREAIVSGALRGRALLDRLLAVPFRDRDAWIDEVLGIEAVPPDDPALPRGSVPYLPCGVEDILATVLEVPLSEDDELVDLGSGLGRVVLLGHLLSGARASGIEIQEHLVHAARACAEALGLSAVSFHHANAAEAAFDGSVFFLYAPFSGAMLTSVLRRLEEIARRKAIVVSAVGLELGQEPWLVPRKTSSAATILYESCVPGVPPRPGSKR